MIAIQSPKKPVPAAEISPEKKAMLAGHGGVEPNLRILHRIFTAISKNQDTPVTEVQGMLQPDIQIGDDAAFNILWLLQDKRMDDLGRERLKSIHMDVARRDYTKPADLGVTPEVEARVKELMLREGMSGRHQNHSIRRMSIEQMALVVHLFRLGASTGAIREAIVEKFQGMAFDKVRAMTRDFYDFGPKAAGWEWDTPAERCKVLPRLTGGK